ncbi:MAG: hypothetical protein NC899_03790 [Candidatus Omnitrophica bacterium]|nr:hypothetical protein [Candidatus Omnitrophota bacterium]
MKYINLKGIKISRFILGGNPFSGFSHQSREMDIKMKKYFTTERIKATLECAEKNGINTFIGRADHFILRVLLEYKEKGGKIQWIAQTCPEIKTQELSIDMAMTGNPVGCYIHGGYTDYLFLNNKTNLIIPLVEKIKSYGILAGIAGHIPEVFLWAEENIDIDFYMCSYYNPVSRKEKPEKGILDEERFSDKDRDKMIDVIKKVKKVVIHYKIMAAGRKNPEEAIMFLSKNAREHDMVCIGIYDEEKKRMIEENIELMKKFNFL